MISREDLESFLVRLGADGASYTELEPGMWSVRPAGAPDVQVVVHHVPPVALFRVKVMELPADADRRAALALRLLELNAADLVHGAYGVSGTDVLLTEALELAGLDYAEFLAAYESITLALASHARELAPFRAET
ncbi:MAG: YbjN domain-containing protein [Gemmatimonadaceae bacterium]|jgi:hypothetical protein|nr:YbjN domain-containing protein [Gemmatimonadaceae bacterium]